MSVSDLYTDEPEHPGFAKVIIDRRSRKLWINDVPVDCLVAEDVEIGGVGPYELPTLDLRFFIERVEWVDGYQPRTVTLQLPALAAIS